MNTERWLEMSAVYSKLPKAQLVARLVETGTIYPTIAQLRRLPKDELVSMLIGHADGEER